MQAAGKPPPHTCLIRLRAVGGRGGMGRRLSGRRSIEKRTYSRKYIGCRDVIGGRNAASPQATALITY